MFHRALIIGVGQIGASIGLNLVGKRLAKEVVGIGRDPANLRQAVRKKAIHRVGSIRELPLLDENDLIILAMPVQSIAATCRFLPRLPLILDVGSTKVRIMKEADRRRLRFVGCHPIAGTERAGAAAGKKDLFRGRICLLTPGKGSRSKDLRAVARLWKLLGARTHRLDAVRHDGLLAVTSHLPHVVAFSLAAAVGKILRLPRDGFAIFSSLRGTTRVAASPAEMWGDIFLENRAFVLKAVDAYLRELKRLRALIARGSAGGLLRFLEGARRARLRFPETPSP